jgi:6-pyruvoyltetrahydropterin/6-carboxytetrahydropterin synthase
MVEDFEVVSRVVKAAVISELDHRSLNELMDNPTAENLVVWIWGRLAGELPLLAELTLWETRKACAVMKKGDPLSEPGKELDRTPINQERPRTL